jgi:DHA1 family tetracycline resistance protein-like MFS transporter
MMVGPGLFTFTFAFFINPKMEWIVPGAPWYLGAFLLFVAAGMATRIPRVAADTEPAVLAPPE